MTEVLMQNFSMPNQNFYLSRGQLASTDQNGLIWVPIDEVPVFLKMGFRDLSAGHPQGGQLRRQV